MNVDHSFFCNIKIKEVNLTRHNGLLTYVYGIMEYLQQLKICL